MFRANVLGSLIIVIVVCAAVHSAAGQMIPPGPADTGLGGANSITGTVLASAGERVQRPIAVRLQSSTRGDRVVMTDETGNFAFRGLPGGDYNIVIDKEREYEPYTQSVSVVQMRGFPGQNYLLSIRLTARAANTVKPAVVNSELAGVPETALVFYRKAAELTKAGDHDGAIEQLKLAVADYPKFVLAYNDLGTQYLNKKDLGRADDAFKTALNIDKTSFAPLLNHGIVMFMIKRYADAEAIFKQVVTAKEGSAVGHYFLGKSLAYQDKAKWDAAEKELVHALALAAESQATSMNDAHYILGLIYADRGDKKRQANAWETFLRLSPDAPNAEQIRNALNQLKTN